ncbi:MAG: ABC transporter permease [Clostridia bacterium]|nr:ABC transporter permease [Clostridia bacterium]
MKILSKIYFYLVFAFLYIPIIVMIVFSFNTTRYRTANFEGFTLKWYEELFKNDEIMEALGVSLSIAVIAAIVSTILGTLAAIGVFAMKGKLRSSIMTVNNIPMVNPEIVTGVSLLLLFVFIYSSVGILKPGYITLLIAHITFCVPYVLLSVLPKLRQMNPNLYEAALDLGCHPVRAFFKVVMPEIMPGIITGLIMSFTLSLDDFVISYFTSGSSIQTLPLLIYSMTKKNVKPTIFALSTLMFAVIFVLLLAVNIKQIKDAAGKSKNKKLKGELVK